MGHGCGAGRNGCGFGGEKGELAGNGKGFAGIGGELSPFEEKKGFNAKTPSRLRRRRRFAKAGELMVSIMYCAPVS